MSWSRSSWAEASWVDMLMLVDFNSLQVTHVLTKRLRSIPMPCQRYCSLMPNIVCCCWRQRYLSIAVLPTLSHHSTVLTCQLSWLPLADSGRCNAPPPCDFKEKICSELGNNVPKLDKNVCSRIRPKSRLFFYFFQKLYVICIYEYALLCFVEFDARTHFQNIVKIVV